MKFNRGSNQYFMLEKLDTTRNQLYMILIYGLITFSLIDFGSILMYVSFSSMVQSVRYNFKFNFL